MMNAKIHWPYMKITNHTIKGVVSLITLVPNWKFGFLPLFSYICSLVGNTFSEDPVQRKASVTRERRRLTAVK